MIWFLLVPAVFALSIKSMWFGKYPPDDGMEWLMTGVLAFILAAVIGGGAGASIALGIGLFFDAHPVLVSDESLVAIRDKDGVSGTFFLGSGVIKGDQYYFYYATMPDGSFRPGKVYASQGVRVYEEDRKDAKLETYEWVLNKPWAWLLSIPANKGGWSYKFYVPKGTIRTGYTM